MCRCYFLSFFFGLLNVQKIGSLLKNITLVDFLLIVSTISFGRDVLTGYSYKAISRKVVEKSARDNPERYCRWVWVHCSSKKFERMAREAMDICLRVLKESSKSRFDSYSVKWIDRIPHYLSGLSRAHFFQQLSRNSCILFLVFSFLWWMKFLEMKQNLNHLTGMQF